jgi:hypothetical protein
VSDQPSNLDDLPILRELGDGLKAAFHGANADVVARRRNPVPASRRRAPMTRARSWLGAGVLAAAVVIVALIVSVDLGIDGAQLWPGSAQAAQVLRQAAVAAETQPVAFPRDNQFYYLRSVTTSIQAVRSNPFTPLRSSGSSTLPKAVVTLGQQLWFSADRTGLTRFRLISIRFPNAADRRAWERLGRPSFAPPQSSGERIGTLSGGGYLLGNIKLTRRELLAAPTDPRTLYARLYAAGGSPAEVFTEIGDTLRSRPAPAALRAALYRTLALVPGIRLVGPVTDISGRHGIAVGFVQDGIENELIFDPASATMLAERTIVAGRSASGVGLARGTIISSTTYLQRAVTNTKGGRSR